MLSLSCVLGLLLNNSTAPVNAALLTAYFNAWARVNSRKYIDVTEAQARYDTFLSNLRDIVAINSNNKSYWVSAVPASLMPQ